MKKLSIRRKRWHMRRARNRARRAFGIRVPPLFPGLKRDYVEYIDVWQGGEFERAICLSRPVAPPSALNFVNNLPRTIEYFDALRRRAFSKGALKNGFMVRPSRPNALPRVLSYSNFSLIEEISISAAVVMAADYERLMIRLNEVPPTINLEKWHPEVFRRLFELGFFEIVGLTEAAGHVTLSHGNTMTMPIVSGSNADDLRRVDFGLNLLAQFLGCTSGLPDEVQIPFLTAISEALTNVTNHAYAQGYKTQYPHVGRFWISATAEKVTNSMTIVVYDQGNTIPVTYPRIARVERIERYLRRALRRMPEHDYVNDEIFVRAALRYGGSRTDQAHRGKGFPQMLEALDWVGQCTVRVVSRGGWCVRYPNGRLESGVLEQSIGGTLVEWTVIVSQQAVGQ